MPNQVLIVVLEDYSAEGVLKGIEDIRSVKAVKAVKTIETVVATALPEVEQFAKE